MKQYPNEAGFKEDTTSREAAQAIETSGRAATLRENVLELYKSGFEGTADEVAQALDENILSVRPRVSELKTRGLIHPTGERRRVGRISHAIMHIKPAPPEQGWLF